MIPTNTDDFDAMADPTALSEQNEVREALRKRTERLENALRAIIDAANRGVIVAGPRKRTEGQKLIAKARAALE